MKQRFYIYRRREVYDLQDSRTGKQQSLETKDKNEALRLLEIKRQSTADTGFNQIVLKTCLTTQDPLMARRTWQTVMDQIQIHGKESSRKRYSPTKSIPESCDMSRLAPKSPISCRLFVCPFPIFKFSSNVWASGTVRTGEKLETG